jgi:hypothetical protein
MSEAFARTALAGRQPRDVLTTIELVTPGGCLVPLADERDPVSTKSLVLRVARVATGDRQMATIGPSNPLVGFAIVLWAGDHVGVGHGRGEVDGKPWRRLRWPLVQVMTVRRNPSSEAD